MTYLGGCLCTTPSPSHRRRRQEYEDTTRHPAGHMAVDRIATFLSGFTNMILIILIRVTLEQIILIVPRVHSKTISRLVVAPLFSAQRGGKIVWPGPAWRV